ncbi:MAG: ATP-binding protein [Candidatus Onthomonas sp.]
MESIHYISCLRFSMQLIIAESVFLIGRPRKSPFGPRLALGLTAYLAAASGWYSLLHAIPGEILMVYMSFWLGLFVLTMLAISFCFDLIPIEVIFVGTGGYAVEHIAFSAAKIIQYLTGWYDDVIGVVAENLIFRFLIYVILTGLIYLLLIRKNRDKEAFQPHDARIALLALATLLIAIMLSVFYSSDQVAEQMTVVSNIICPTYGIACCLLVLIMEYYILRENRLKREQELMEQTLQMADAHQKSSREAIDIINMKCHDLKNQIRALASINDAAARSEYVSEVQQAVDLYDATYHTGCEALDYVLQEKSLLSNQHHVALSCMVEGAAISFMRPPDIYALMGNALDNALECVIREPEELRIISLQIRQRGQMVMIHLENQCSRRPKFQDGLPVTDKKDKDFHGFGVKSIRYIVEKYHGELVMRAQNGMFFLDIIFPRQ